MCRVRFSRVRNEFRSKMSESREMTPRTRVFAAVKTLMDLKVTTSKATESYEFVRKTMVRKVHRVVKVKRIFIHCRRDRLTKKLLSGRKTSK